MVYGGTGKAARNWESFDAIVETLKDLESDETLLVQSGKPVGVWKTNEWAPRVLWPTPTWLVTGRTGSTSANSKTKA